MNTWQGIRSLSVVQFIVRPMRNTITIQAIYQLRGHPLLHPTRPNIYFNNKGGRRACSFKDAIMSCRTELNVLSLALPQSRSAGRSGTASISPLSSHFYRPPMFTSNALPAPRMLACDFVLSVYPVLAPFSPPTRAFFHSLSWSIMISISLYLLSNELITWFHLQAVNGTWSKP